MIRTEPTPEEGGNILVLPTTTTSDLDPAAPIAFDWRSGDVWRNGWCVSI